MTITLLTISVFSNPCVSKKEECCVVSFFWLGEENVYPDREKVVVTGRPVGCEESRGVCFLLSDFFFCSRVFFCFAIKRLGYSIDTFTVKRLR